ncbi:putative uncharacterized protein [Mycoplasma sp. CAG:877]|nr:putative uncharacterized protein [Mycoplasma sp. CAG:877]
MIGSIIEIIDNRVLIKLAIDINKQPNLVGLHVVFEDETKKIVAEIVNASQTEMTAVIVGELLEKSFIPGATKRPSFKSSIRLVTLEELELMLGSQNIVAGQTNFGTSNIYDGYRINVDLNDFFSNHFSVLGNSGSGKSCTVASILQKLMIGNGHVPKNANFFFFDAFGEYNSAFSGLHAINPEFNYKYYTTNVKSATDEILRIPVWLLDVDDLALLLDADTPTQLPIIEKTLNLVPILTGQSDAVIKKKNDIIARAIQDILLSGNDSTKIRDQVTAVLTKFNTAELNLESQIIQPGYVRTLKQCLFVDKTGKMQEMELVVEFIRGYIVDEEEEVQVTDLNPFYSLADLEMAMDFALINEGILKSSKVFDYANILSVRLHTLVNGEYKEFFSYPRYITKEQFVESLLISNNGAKCQIVNFNINYVDDRMAKVITKIVSRMLFEIASNTVPRGSRAFHIIIEEAHRYVIKDKDVDLLGYNIFERITKEGRKYGIFLGLITQRPSELSDTCISQCTNFVILRTLHPKDLEYIKNMVPNISMEIVQQLKNLKPGNCIAFGNAFKVPISMYIDLPNPRPMSNNVDINSVWYSDSPTLMNNIGGVAEIRPIPSNITI